MDPVIIICGIIGIVTGLYYLYLKLLEGGHHVFDKYDVFFIGTILILLFGPWAIKNYNSFIQESKHPFIKKNKSWFVWGKGYPHASAPPILLFSFGCCITCGIIWQNDKSANLEDVPKIYLFISNSV